MYCRSKFMTMVWIAILWRGSQTRILLPDLSLLNELFERRMNFSNPETVAFTANRERALNYTQTIQNDLAKFLISSFLTFCPNIPLCYDKGEFYRNYSFPFYGKFPVCEECSCALDCVYNCCVTQYIPTRSLIDSDHDKTVKTVPLSCTTTDIGAVYDGKTGEKIKISKPRYWLVVNCPEEYSKNIVWQRCKKFLPSSQLSSEELHTPVTSSKTNQSYQNKYCAQCFDEKENDLHPWKKVFLTNNSDEMNRLKEDPFLAAYENRIMVLFKPPSFLDQDLACYLPDVTHCNETGLWSQYDERLQWACENMKQTLFYFHSISNLRFKNLYCAMCNTFSPEYTLPISVEYRRLPSSLTFSVVDVYRQTLGLFPSLLSFTADKITSRYRIESNCDFEMFYSPVLRKCLPVICDPEYVQQGPKCHRRISNELPGHFFLSALICHTEQNKHVKLDKMHTLLINELRFLSRKFWKIDIHFSPSLLTKSNRHCCPFEFSFVPEKITNVVAMTNFLLLFLKNLTLNEDPVSHLQIKITKFDQSTFNMSSSAIFELTWKNSELRNFIHRDLFEHQYCPKIYLPESYHLNYSNFEVCIIEYDLCIESHLVKFEQENHVIALCLDDYRRMVETYTRKSSGEGSPETYFSVVCLSVSSFGCILIVSTFCVSQKALNVSKKMLIALSLSLFLANTVYTASRFFIYYYPVCMAFGLLSHFCWLLVFALMTSLCLDMLLSLFGVLKFERSISFSAYLISTCTLSMALVATHIRLSYHKSEGSSLGYSKTTCFVENQTLKIFTLVLPIALMIFLNTLLFILTIFCLKRNSSISNSREKQYFKIYLKLSLITGMAWFSGLIYELVDIPFFSHIHSFFNGCIGMFIFIAFGGQKDAKRNHKKDVSKSLSSHCDFYKKRSELNKI